MHITPLAIVGVLVAPLVLASPAGAWPGDGYGYTPYPPAVVVVPAPPYPPPGYYAAPGFHAPPVRTYAAPQYGYAPPAAAYYPPPEPALVPLRPRSCGKYRYWNGDYCADARFERPYVGPR